MEKSFRPLRMASAIASLLVALFSLEGTYELVMDSLLPLMRYGNEFTVYGWGVIGAIAARVAITGALLWAFARFGSSKPLPFSRRSRAGTLHLGQTSLTPLPARSNR
jgi:hypothetical protein